MNNFDGIIELYPQIAIDNFSPKILTQTKIKLFILTHFHQDHMSGLQDVHLIKKLLNQKDTKFFCSPITRKFLEASTQFKSLSSHCTEIQCETPTLFQLNDKLSVIITFYGSGHCPGSVMALIQGDKGNVLFTGDFRLPLGSAHKLPFLTNTQIHTVYIDCTFFREEKKNLPSREESLTELLKMIDNNHDRDIYIKTSAKIGYEHVFSEIYYNTGQKVHVSEEFFGMYEKLPEIRELLTTNSEETRIHVCLNDTIKKSTLKNNKSLLYTCNYSNTLKRKAIKIHLSTMWFTYFMENDQILAEIKSNKESFYENYYRLCYSFHSSFNEIVDFVRTLKPIKLKAIAMPNELKECDITDYFRKNFNLFIDENDKNFPQEPIRSTNELLLRQRSSIFESSSNKSDDELDFGAPARKKASIFN
jgi:DNA cross-link repair 1C protein